MRDMQQTPSHPSFDEIDRKISQALEQLLDHDAYLLQIDANERAISHRLGMYLQLLFEEWHVDCEYNRNLGDPKRVKTAKGFLDPAAHTRSIAETEAITVFPDIIIHKRGTSNNLLVIEMKKTTSQVGDAFDYFKLRSFKYQLRYPHALFLKLITNQQNVGIAIKQYMPEQDVSWILP
jgi:hypothetical protein